MHEHRYRTYLGFPLREMEQGLCFWLSDDVSVYLVQRIHRLGRRGSSLVEVASRAEKEANHVTMYVVRSHVSPVSLGEEGTFDEPMEIECTLENVVCSVPYRRSAVRKTDVWALEMPKALCRSSADGFSTAESRNALSIDSPDGVVVEQKPSPDVGMSHPESLLLGGQDMCTARDALPLHAERTLPTLYGDRTRPCAFKGEDSGNRKTTRIPGQPSPLDPGF
ncbi:hypothetical protein ACRALDRAFT_1072060 [Sodiomyces alcalophilus JCM 7366]|uniref:uncharacterized protein n=1 Tax=Sodiomyces alcalophilus JCM 7366 TaxID=591952 RepID=UPI0039B4A42C